MKAVVYNRTSTTEQHPELQLDDCKKYVESKGLVLDKVFTEHRSAFKDDSKRDVFNAMLDYCKLNKIEFIVVWNMDRFSRQPAEKVLEQVKLLSVMHGIKVVAVNGDLWSDVVESVGRFNDMGFIGQAIVEFLEKLIRGLEYHRAHTESLVKSDRVKLAVRHEEGRTLSYKGNRWGRREVEVDKLQVFALRNEGKSFRAIAKMLGLSLGKVQSVLKSYSEKQAPVVVEKQGV